ncbi:MAG: hypothetical protein IPJ04_09940 [Candidatus Eisenbacteria bacterium]|nr:hypothetical protein [Candidatus Eisenbacteria bacterium]
MIERGEADVFDVNAPQRWREARVPGARNLDPTHFNAAALPGDKMKSIVFYCSGPLCRKAPNAAVRRRSSGTPTFACCPPASLAGNPRGSPPTRASDRRGMPATNGVLGA